MDDCWERGSHPILILAWASVFHTYILLGWHAQVYFPTHFFHFTPLLLLYVKGEVSPDNKTAKSLQSKYNTC